MEVVDRSAIEPYTSLRPAERSATKNSDRRSGRRHRVSDIGSATLGRRLLAVDEERAVVGDVE